MNSDSRNVLRVLNNSARGNETWQLQSDGDFIKIGDMDEDFDEVIFDETILEDEADS